MNTRSLRIVKPEELHGDYQEGQEDDEDWQLRDRSHQGTQAEIPGHVTQNVQRREIALGNFQCAEEEKES